MITTYAIIQITAWGMAALSGIGCLIMFGIDYIKTCIK